MPEKIKVTFLGTSGMIPDARRNHPAIFLSYKNEGILFDCGEGTQIQFRKAKINPGKITRIVLTHWHGDHTLGLPGLLKTLSMSEYTKKLFIYGPRGIARRIEEMDRAFGRITEFEIEVVEIAGQGVFFENKDFSLESAQMSHGVPCNAYNFVAKGNSRIDKKKMKKLKLPQGKHMQEMKSGKDIVVQGKKFKAKDFVFKEEDKKVSVVLDTEFNSNIVPLVKDSNLLISESTFGKGLEGKAKDYKHLTVEQAANIAKRGHVGKLYLTHLSARNDSNLKEFLSDAKKIFPETFLAKDLMEVDL